jgi:hypothetical protein
MQAITPSPANRGRPGHSDRGILRGRWLSHGRCLRHPTSASSATARMASALMPCSTPMMAAEARPADPLFPGTSPVLVRPGHRGVHRHVPGDQPGRIRPCLQGGHDLPPGAVPLPVAEQPVHRLPVAIPVRDVPLRRTGADPPPDPVDQLPPCPRRRPTRLLAARQQRLQHRPLRIGQVGTAGHRYGRHEVSAEMRVFLVDDPSTGDLTALQAKSELPNHQTKTNTSAPQTTS